MNPCKGKSIVTEMVKEGTLLWEPTEECKKQSNMMRYMMWLKNNRQLAFHSYETLWQWSVTDIEGFWESLWAYFDIKSASPYREVLAERKMPGAKWFAGAELNFAEHIFRNMNPDHPAIISRSEIRPLQTMTWQQLYDQTAAFAAGLKAAGIQPGDRVVAYMPNIAETVIAFLACASIGAIWSSSSPDFGSSIVVDRFKQIEPRILIAADGYRYGGKDYDRLATVQSIQAAIPSLEKIILLPYLSEEPDVSRLQNIVTWDDFAAGHPSPQLDFNPLPFDHPIWVLYSSGTTGLPKAIVQGQGGILLEHLKTITIHMNVKPGDRFFWYTTTGWMMWNMVVGALLSQASIVLYDGNPGYPDLETLWKFADETEMTLFGTSASFLINCRNKAVSPKSKYKLDKLASVKSTGSPLPPEGFQWVYEHVRSDVWLSSTSGGTDVCAPFVAGSPLLPVHAGEIQCRALGAKVEAYNEDGVPVSNEVGELVVTEPMPSMPLFFWNDEDGQTYFHSYFDTYPGVWRHGDWIKITPKGSCQIYGRSDATINRGGIRMGTSEIYSAVEGVPGIADSLVIDVSNTQGKAFMPLFVVLNEGVTLDEGLKNDIINSIREHCSPRHIPNGIYEIKEVPRTLNGKKLEVPIKKMLMGFPLEKAVNKDSMSNPDSLEYFIAFAKQFAVE